MRRTEILYLAAVGLFALLFARTTIERTGEALGRIAAAQEGAGGAAGKPREVNLRRIRQLIREGRLSDREALFYHRGAEILLPPGAPRGAPERQGGARETDRDSARVRR